MTNPPEVTEEAIAIHAWLYAERCEEQRAKALAAYTPLPPEATVDD